MVKLSIKEPDFGITFKDFTEVISSFVESFERIKSQDPDNSDKYEKIIKNFLSKTIKEL